MSSGENEFTHIKLLRTPSFKDLLAKKAFLSYISWKGIPQKVSQAKNQDTSLTQRQQAWSYEENGEIIYRHAKCKEGLHDDIPGVPSLVHIINEVCEERGNDRFLGTRPIISETCEETVGLKKIVKYELGDYQWITFSEGKNMINNMSLIFKKQNINRENRVALFADTSAFWFLASHALFKLSSPIVTVYATLTDSNLVFCINFTKCVGIVLDDKTYPRLNLILDQITTLKYVYMLSESKISDDFKQSLKDRNIELVLIDVEQAKQPITEQEEKDLQETYPNREDLALIMFTSGSTGVPKGVMISHGNIISSLASVLVDKDIWKEHVYCAYLPQAHILEFIAENVIVYFGGCLGFGRPFTLTDQSPMVKPGSKGDLTLLKPRLLATVPLLLNRIQQAVMDKISASSSVKKMIFETAYNIKLDYIKAGKKTKILDKIVFKKFKQILGGRIENILAGGAYLGQDVEDFFSVCFANCKQGYGLTETTCVGSLPELDYWHSGSVGSISKCAELKFSSWDEGGYHIDDPQGPRGEILLCSKSLSQGYYQNEEETKKSFVKDEKTGKTWFKTGDIGWLLPDGSLKIVDRKKDIVKLLHGEYVSLCFVEDNISKSNLVDRVCVMPSSNSQFLVSLLIPNIANVKTLAFSKYPNLKSLDEMSLMNDENVCDLVHLTILELLQELHVPKHSIPQKTVLILDQWTPESGMITPSAKLRRNIIKDKYIDHL